VTAKIKQNWGSAEVGEKTGFNREAKSAPLQKPQECGTRKIRRLAAGVEGWPTRHTWNSSGASAEKHR